MKCVICGKRMSGMGHNAEPLKSGRCCSKCNEKEVLPYRLANFEIGKPLPTDNNAIKMFKKRRLKKL